MGGIASVPADLAKECTVKIGVETTEASDQRLSEFLERELPGFWAYLKARHPQFAPYGRPDQGPLGYLHAAEVYDAMAETIPAYVKALRSAT